MAIVEPWSDAHNVERAWQRCVRAYRVERPLGFKEKLAPDKSYGAWAYNWSFGALLSAYAAALGIVPLRAALQKDLPMLRTALEGYRVSKYHAFKSTPAKWRGDLYFDDNAWIALAALDIFEHTREQLWMDMALSIYQFLIEEGYDPSRGAVFWRMHPKSSLHVCSTGPTALLGTRLMSLGQGVEQDRIDRMIQWCWQMRNDQGLFQDHWNLITRRMDSAVYTYNTGTPLHTLLVMEEIRDPGSYREMAEDILSRLPLLLRGGQLPPTPWFNAVLLRALAKALTSHRAYRARWAVVMEAYQQQMVQAWERFGRVDAPLALESNDSRQGLLLRDAAASVETLAWLHRIESQSPS